MDIKLNFVPAPKISNSDVKYKGFHPREKSNYVKFTNNKSKELYDELDRIFSDLIDKQQNYIYEIEYQANHSMTCPLKTEIDTKEYILSPILEGTELVFNSMMKQMREKLEKTSKEGNKTLNDKKAEVESIFGKYSNYAINFYGFLKYLYKILYLTCFNILRMFQGLLSSIINYVERFVSDKFGIHSNYLFLSKEYLSETYLTEALEKKVTPEYRFFFTTGLSSLISDCFKEYKRTYENPSTGNIKKLTKKRLKEQENKIEKTISDTLTEETSKYIEHELKSIISKKQKRKVFQLNGQIGEAIDKISQKSASLTEKKSLTEEQNKKILELKKALSDLSDILVSKKGKLTNEQVQLFDEVFKGIRNTKGTDYKLSETEIRYLKKVYHEGDGPTARIIINLFSMITDNGDKMLTAIKNYIDKLMPNTYITYDCTDLYRQINEGKKLIKIKLINYPNYLGLLNTLDILKRILEGKTPFFSATFESDIISVFKIYCTHRADYDQIKIKSNEFAFRVGENLIISQNIAIQKLILSFLKKTDNDKNFIVNKIKEQIAKSKPAKPESAKPESDKPESDEPKPNESDSAKSKSDKKGANKHQRKKARNKRARNKKKKRK